MDIEYFKKKYNLDLVAGVDYKIKENHKIPAQMEVEYFVFGKTMYCKYNFKKVPKHEYLHVAQFKKYGVVLVSIHYVFNILKNYIKYRNFEEAFKEVPFEVEAREYEQLQS